MSNKCVGQIRIVRGTRSPARRLCIVFAAMLPCVAAVCAATQADAVFDAMRSEMKRATTLSLNQLDKPYFVSYAVDDGRNWSASATLGALISSDDSRFRIPQVRIRVGDYKFDNTNFAGGGFGGAR